MFTLASFYSGRWTAASFLGRRVHFGRPECWTEASIWTIIERPHSIMNAGRRPHSILRPYSLNGGLLFCSERWPHSILNDGRWTAAFLGRRVGSLWTASFYSERWTAANAGRWTLDDHWTASFYYECWTAASFLGRRPHSILNGRWTAALFYSERLEDRSLIWRTDKTSNTKLRKKADNFQNRKKIKSLILQQSWHWMKILNEESTNYKFVCR